MTPRILKTQTDLYGVEGRKGLPRFRDIEVPKTCQEYAFPLLKFASRSWLRLPVREELHSPGWRTPIAQQPQTHAHPHPKLTVETPLFLRDLSVGLLREALSGVCLFSPGWGVVAKENPPIRPGLRGVLRKGGDSLTCVYVHLFSACFPDGLLCAGFRLGL